MTTTSAAVKKSPMRRRDRWIAGLIVGVVSAVTIGGYLALQANIPPAPPGPPPTTAVTAP